MFRPREALASFSRSVIRPESRPGGSTHSGVTDALWCPGAHCFVTYLAYERRTKRARTDGATQAFGSIDNNRYAAGPDAALT